MREGMSRQHITLAQLIQRESGLSERESERLADAWVDDVRSEMLNTGISVVRGVGTFTLTDAGMRFDLDEDFPTLYDLPVIEGFRRGPHELAALDPHSGPADTDHDEPETPEPSSTGGDSSHSASADPEPAETAPSAPEPTTPESSSSARTVATRSARQSRRDTPRTAAWIAAALIVIVMGAFSYRFLWNTSGPAPTLAVTDADEEAQLTTTRTDSASMGVLPDSLSQLAGLSRQNENNSAVEPAGADEFRERFETDGTDEVASTTQLGSASSSSPTQPATGIAPIADDPSAISSLSHQSGYSDIRQGMGGYTLIVGSSRRQETALALMSTLAPPSWPSGVLTHDAGDVVRYRVAVGHFQTAALADSARTRYASELPEGTWVLSVR